MKKSGLILLFLVFALIIVSAVFAVEREDPIYDEDQDGVPDYDKKCDVIDRCSNVFTLKKGAFLLGFA